MNWADQKYAIGRGIAAIRHKNGMLYRYFLRGIIESNLNELLGGATGSTFPNVSKRQIQEISFLVPSLSEQMAIASVLGSLDDKIDLLTRQNRTLESIAETFFRQWFIEEAKDDWEERKLLEFGEIVCGKTPQKSKKEYFNGGIPFVKIPDMHGKTFIYDTEDSLTILGRDSQKNKTLPEMSILVSCIATVGLVSMNICEAQTNQQINSIIPKRDYYRYYVYLTIKFLYDELHAMASGGTATLNLNTGNFSQIKIPFPSDELLTNFDSNVSQLFQKIKINQFQIRILKRTRDTLLPKLMSGEVRVRY